DKKNYEYGYELAFKLACEQLAKIDDIKQQCLKSGAQYQIKDSQKVITVEYLNRQYQVTLPDIEISIKDSGEAVPLRDKILILHYLTQAKGTLLSNKTITYKELPEGLIYFPTFVKRAIKPLLDHFGKEPHRLIDIAKLLGGQKAEYGDTAVTINAFRRVPITLVIWQGDEEFRPEASILFDSTITDYLTTEDIHVLCETIAWRLVKSDKQR
ncbi:MAG: DUF3786 domain-containing protein, partial [Chloroflexi bacterium]|nr:DUF3786 domain-containing protein [Chloroflexota bacterium]